MFIKRPAGKLSISMRKPIFGIGINDADYVTTATIDGKQVKCPAYQVWYSMLTRCYSQKHKIHRPTYTGCSVASEWFKFSAFAAWFESNSIEGYALDKDIISKGNHVYSPETCMFIPNAINSLLICSESNNGVYPVGVYCSKNASKFVAMVRVDCNREYLGLFETATEARVAYIKAKNEEIKRKCKQYPEFSKYLINHILKEGE